MINGIGGTCFIINKVKVELMRSGLVPDLMTILNMFNSPVVGIIQDDDNIHISNKQRVADSMQERNIHRKKISRI